MKKETTPPPEKKQREFHFKFNMDLAFQELLHNLLQAAVGAKLSGNLNMHYKMMHQAQQMLYPGIADREKFDKLCKQNQRNISNLNIVMGKYGIGYSIEEGYKIFNKPMWYHTHNLPQDFNKYYSILEDGLDNWEKEIRLVMARLGLIMLRKATGTDAATN